MLQTFETPGTVELEIHIPAGTIEIAASERTTTEVEIDEDDDVDVELHPLPGGGHRISIERRRPKHVFGWRRDEVEVRVHAPSGAIVRGDSGSADLSIGGSVGAVTFGTGSGEVEIDRCDGDLGLRVASGDVRVAHVGGRANVDSASGDVELDAAGGDVTVRSASGDVRIGVARASVQVSTASGDVTLEDVSSGRAVLNSMSGDVRVAVRRGTRVWLDLATTSGDASSDLASADPDTAGDGPTLELRAASVSGDVIVERSMHAVA
jgi:DUF4097 and DUF4098 domain-containing protein YvlB